MESDSLLLRKHQLAWPWISCSQLSLFFPTWLTRYFWLLSFSPRKLLYLVTYKNVCHYIGLIFVLKWLGTDWSYLLCSFKVWFLFAHACTHGDISWRLSITYDWFNFLCRYAKELIKNGWKIRQIKVNYMLGTEYAPV